MQLASGRQLPLGSVENEIRGALNDLRVWIEGQNYCGYEPYDLLNSPVLCSVWSHSKVLSSLLIQIGKRLAGVKTRCWLRVPESKNPKALGLFLAGYCDLARVGCNHPENISYLKREMKRLSAPGEADFCWGYDWNFVSLRGGVMRAFAPNAIATVFCAEALLECANVLEDQECGEMAISAARFCATRLKRSSASADEICFSYTPENTTVIYNSSVLVAALLARVGSRLGKEEYGDLARRAVAFVCRRQRTDGAWTYGAGRRQQWVDGFHTGYNLCALKAYRQYTGDIQFDESIQRGYEFYKSRCFTVDGVPKYFEDRLYPIDIHACSQALITFSEFSKDDADAITRAIQVLRWTTAQMRSAKGFFYYQRHRFWTNETPYMRWAQAWMFRALARLLVTLEEHKDAFVD